MPTWSEVGGGGETASKFNDDGLEHESEQNDTHKHLVAEDAFAYKEEKNPVF